MREIIGLFAYDRGLITDDLVRMRLEASVNPPVRDSWAAMFPPPRQRWVDDLALSGAELNAVSQPVLLVPGADDRVVPCRSSSALLVDLLPACRLHLIAACDRRTLSQRTASS